MKALRIAECTGDKRRSHLVTDLSCGTYGSLKDGGVWWHVYTACGQRFSSFNLTWGELTLRKSELPLCAKCQRAEREATDD